MRLLDKTRLAVLFPGINVISVFDCSENCKTRRHKQTIILFAEVKASIIVYLIEIHTDHSSNLDYVYFPLNQIQYTNKSPQNTFLSWADGWGLTGSELYEIINNSAPKSGK